MPVYVMAHVAVTNPEGYAKYIAQVPSTIAAHGGRYLARSPAPEVLEGDKGLNRAALVEFPTLEAAKGWYHSKEYRAILPHRQKNSRANLLLVEGVPPA